MTALNNALTEQSNLRWKIQELKIESHILKSEIVALELQLTATKNLLNEREKELGL